MSKINEIPDFQAMWAQTKSDLVHIAATEGLNFFQDTFDKQGFTDVAFEPWKQKSVPDGYKILLHTSFLKNSVQVFNKNEKRIVFGSDAEYAEIHNDGGTIQITNTPRAKRFFWFMYKATGQIHWKYMALSKKTHFAVKIPKRQFIGESKTLLNIIETNFKKRIIKEFQNIKMKKL